MVAVGGAVITTSAVSFTWAQPFAAAMVYVTV
jgi:hypothetical protein